MNATPTPISQQELVQLARNILDSHKRGTYQLPKEEITALSSFLRLIERREKLKPEELQAVDLAVRHYKQHLIAKNNQ